MPRISKTYGENARPTLNRWRCWKPIWTATATRTGGVTCRGPVPHTPPPPPPARAAPGAGPESSSQSSPGAGDRMDRHEAYQVLGLRPDASREEIRAAHRRLIQRVHPDHGGSSYLAARINQARDVLLNG